MCYEFERWNWKSRTKQRDTVPTTSESAQPRRVEAKTAQAPKEPAREVKVPEKLPA
jgi:hypothetical protein